MQIDRSFWRGKRVLLTGHTGFKGAWLLLWLQELGSDVWGYSLEADSSPNLFRLIQPALGANFHHFEGDLADMGSLKQWVNKANPDVVLHLAAQPLVRQSYIDPVGTWKTNVMGTLHLLEALRPLSHPCVVVLVTTDKVYENQEWLFGYRENDPLGGHDPYSASKAGAEIAISSWRSSFCGPAPHQTSFLRIATARAGNVIGGGDWATDRVVPDAMRALAAGDPIEVRNPRATRPWQHVLEPLSGYLLLAEWLASKPVTPNEAFNFGPTLESNQPVGTLVDTILSHWPGTWRDVSDPMAPHEANLLHLQIDKAYHYLSWQPRWDYATTIGRTVAWYRAVCEGRSAFECCQADLTAYSTTPNQSTKEFNPS